MNKSIPLAVDALIEIHLTYLIVSDFRRRNVFPMLREEHAARLASPYFVFNVTFDLVKQIKADVEEQYELPSATRSMRQSYNAIRKKMARIIRAPEIEEENRQREVKARQEFKEKACELVGSALDLVRIHLREQDGYRFDEETLCDVERLASEIEDIVFDGEVQSDSDDEEITRADNSPAYKADMPLQKFLKSVTSNLSLVENEEPEGL